MSPTRRDFLLAAAAAPLVFGLGGCSREPAWLPEALRAIRTEGKPGLVFRVPADPVRRCALGHQIAGLLERTDPAALAVTRGSILICLEYDVVRGRIDGARAGEDLIRIDGAGEARAGAAIDPGKDLAAQALALLAAPAPSGAPRLPFGVTIAPASRNPCQESPSCRFGLGCLECGMARVSPRSQAFVKFLAG